jgi:hypothetical protein
VISPHSPAGLGETLVSVLLGFPGEAQPRRLEERWDLELLGGFTTAVDEDYDPVRRLAEDVFGLGFASRPARDLRCR